MIGGSERRDGMCSDRYGVDCEIMNNTFNVITRDPGGGVGLAALLGPADGIDDSDEVGAARHAADEYLHECAPADGL